MAGAAPGDLLMSRIFVAGLANIETTLAVDSFPLPYFPARYPFFGIQTTVSGVGFNVASALTVLGNQVDFMSLIGGDDNAFLVRKALRDNAIEDGLVLNTGNATAQSVVLYDRDGRREIHTDLKDLQDTVYPIHHAVPAIRACDLAVICNINFARPMLAEARAAGKLIATDVHVLSDLEDEYNQDFLTAADILFLSDEALVDTPEDTARELQRRYGNRVIVIGLGSKGALLAYQQDDFIGRFSAVQARPVVNTIGAGDALFAAFIGRYLKTGDPYHALRAAMLFAAYKIGEKGASQGFLSEQALKTLIAERDQERGHG